MTLSPAVSLTRDLLRCPSVTPADAGALGVVEKALKGAGFEIHRANLLTNPERRTSIISSPRSVQALRISFLPDIRTWCRRAM